jgi:hypothetical protein
MPMRPERPRHVRQLELFRPDTVKLEWCQLPAEARRKATRLMARMLLERQHLSGDEEPAGGHDNE